MERNNTTMRQDITISVIMGVYNSENTIANSIESIINQSYTNFEFIICDDGSTDKTYDILLQYKQLYPDKIILLKNNKNLGLAKTLNICLDLASGSYVARMDSDDISKNNRFEKQIEFAKKNPEFIIIGSNAIKFDEKGVYGEIIYPERPQRKDFLFNNPFIHPTMLIRYDILKELNGYNESLYCTRCEDYDLWLRMYSKGYLGFNMQEFLLNYYEGSQNLKKRKYRYRLCETYVRLLGFKKNKILLRGLPFVIKPLIVGLLPRNIYKRQK